MLAVASFQIHPEEDTAVSNVDVVRGLQFPDTKRTKCVIVPMSVFKASLVYRTTRAT